MTRLKRRVLNWHRIIEDYYHAIACIAFERAVVFDNDFADGRMVIAQQRHHIFSVGTFGEPREPAQVAKERGNLTTMAFELLFRPRRQR